MYITKYALTKGIIYLSEYEQKGRKIRSNAFRHMSFTLGVDAFPYEDEARAAAYVMATKTRINLLRKAEALEKFEPKLVEV